MQNFLFLAQNSTFMPSAAGKVAPDVDAVYIFLLVVSLIAFLGVIGYILYVSFAYKRKTENDKTPNIRYHVGLEITWSVIPLVVFLVCFVFGWIVFADLREYHEDDDSVIEIHVTARQWSWTFKYPSGYKITSPMSKTAVDLDKKKNIKFSNLSKTESLKFNTWGFMKEAVPIPIPVNKKIRFIITSQDVLHSFFLPNFRNKIDAVPGRYTYLSIQPTEIGEYVLYCTEFCGTNHSNMMAVIKVMSKKKFDAFFSKTQSLDLSSMPLDKKGKSLYLEKGCNACHSVDGSKGIGPTYKGSFGIERELEDGQKVQIDENYIRNSILNPQSQVAKGYPNVMNSYNGLVTEDEIKALIEYIKSLK